MGVAEGTGLPPLDPLPLGDVESFLDGWDVTWLDGMTAPRARRGRLLVRVFCPPATPYFLGYGSDCSCKVQTDYAITKASTKSSLFVPIGKALPDHQRRESHNDSHANKSETHLPLTLLPRADRCGWGLPWTTWSAVFSRASEHTYVLFPSRVG